LSLWVRVFLIGVSFLLAAASWRFVETPFRRRFHGRARLLFLASASAVVLLALGFLIQRFDGVGSRLPGAMLQYARGRLDFNPVFNKPVRLREAQAGEFLSFGSSRSQDPLDVLVWGDSHAMALLPAVDELSKEHAVRVCAATYYETPPLLDYVQTTRYGLGKDAPAFGQAVLKFIRAHRIPNVILVARWNGYNAGQSSAFHAALGKTINALRESGTKVWLVKEVPNFPWQVPKALARAALFGQAPGNMSLPLAEYFRQIASQEREFSSVAGPNVVLLSPSEFLSKGMFVPSCYNGMALCRDRQHLTIHGCTLIRPMLEPVFQRRVDGNASGASSAPNNIAKPGG
jgi:hypothetical protein